jgi:mRNA interferase RelE/StbE
MSPSAHPTSSPARWPRTRIELGKEPDAPLNGIHSAGLMREWRILYVIDDPGRRITVRHIGHRRDSYHTR